MRSWASVRCKPQALRGSAVQRTVPLCRAVQLFVLQSFAGNDQTGTHPGQPYVVKPRPHAAPFRIATLLSRYFLLGISARCTSVRLCALHCNFLRFASIVSR